MKYILYIQYYFLCRLPPESFLCFSAEDSFAFWNTKSFTPSADLWYDKSKRSFHLGHCMAEDSRARFLKNSLSTQFDSRNFIMKRIFLLNSQLSSSQVPMQELQRGLSPPLAPHFFHSFNISIVSCHLTSSRYANKFAKFLRHVISPVRILCFILY